MAEDQQKTLKMDFLVRITYTHSTDKYDEQNYVGFLSDGKVYGGWQYRDTIEYSLARIKETGEMGPDLEGIWPWEISMPIVLINNKERFR